MNQSRCKTHSKVETRGNIIVFEYRIIEASTAETLSREINEAAEAGFEIESHQFSIRESGWSHSQVIMKRKKQVH